MDYTTILTSKGQLTVPKLVRDKLGLKSGTKVSIYPTLNGEFLGKPQRKSRILDFMGDLKHLDRGEPLNEIREKAGALMAKQVAQRFEKFSKDKQ